jgi:RNA-binding protein
MIISGLITLILIQTEVNVGKLKGYQKKHLKGLAHGMKPVAFVGQKGLSSTVSRAIDESLTTHELIKVKFIDFKEKDQKAEITDAIEQKTTSELVAMIGHVAIFYREQPDPKKRKIEVPKR